MSTIPVIPIGTFDTAKYGRVPLSGAKAGRILANFKRRVLKTDVMVDVDHDMSRSAGWVKSLEMGSFPHARTGEPVKGLLADVEWTPYGESLVSGREYRYLSATLGTYHDEETGEDIPDVLFTVSLTNSPVMKLMPAIAMADDIPGEPVYTVPNTPSIEMCLSLSDIMPSLSDAFTPDITEESPTPADEPQREVALDESPTPPKGGTVMADTEVVEAVVETPEATENDGSLVLSEAFTERDSALTELAELKARMKREKVAGLLDRLSAKGMTEPARAMLSDILLAEGGTIALSEGAEPVTIDEAVMAFAETVEFVPVETHPAEKPEEAEPEMTPERVKVRELLRV